MRVLHPGWQYGWLADRFMAGNRVGSALADQEPSRQNYALQGKNNAWKIVVSAQCAR